MLAAAYLGLGSNLGDRRLNIAEAVKRLRQVSSKVSFSSLYETAPQGFSGQPAFLNAACRIWTPLSPFELLQYLREIQSDLGSPPAFVNGPRTLDVDILLYGPLVLELPGLTVPHPRMLEREFVLAPLVEIAPSVRHPVFKETVRSLLMQLRQTKDASTSVNLPHASAVR